MPGTVTLFGSGETSPTGGQVFEKLVRQLGLPVTISVLETPAGFEANTARVAGRISEFFATRLQNDQPRIHQLAARKKGTAFSPDSPEIVAPLYESSLVFLGPGSPTYAVRQLQDSLAWHILQARHRLGGSLVFASAAAIAAGSPALPVYEIFKVGEDPHWKPGLDFFAPFGLALVIIPHWNNQDGGSELDTSRCFMGQERFDQLLALLPAGKTIVGVDELTAVTLDFDGAACRVAGLGGVHILRDGQQQDFPAGSELPIALLGDYHTLSAPETGLPPEVWQLAQQAAARLAGPAVPSTLDDPGAEVPLELLQLLAARETARQQHDWPQADQLRRQIAELGWQVTDSPSGPNIKPID